MPDTAAGPDPVATGLVVEAEIPRGLSHLRVLRRDQLDGFTPELFRVLRVANHWASLPTSLGSLVGDSSDRGLMVVLRIVRSVTVRFDFGAHNEGQMANTRSVAVHDDATKTDAEDFDLSAQEEARLGALGKQRPAVTKEGYEEMQEPSRELFAALGYPQRERGSDPEAGELGGDVDNG